MWSVYLVSLVCLLLLEKELKNIAFTLLTVVKRKRHNVTLYVQCVSFKFIVLLNAFTTVQCTESGSIS